MEKGLSLHVVLDASLEELVSILEKESDLSSVEAFYGQCILHAHRGELKLLKELREKGKVNFSHLPEWPGIDYVLNLRLATRDRKIDEALLKEGKRLSKNGSFGAWEGEAAMLIGSGYFQLEQFAPAKDWFMRSAKELEKIGCRKKSLRSSVNAIIMETHLDRSANFIPRYFDLHKKAEKRGGDSYVSCICFLNISREYQLLGTPVAALKYANMALEFAEPTFGAQQYYLVLAHRSQVLCELGRMSDARLDYELAMASPHVEVQAALKVVSALLREHFHDLPASPGKEGHLLNSWKSNRDKKQKGLLSELETALVDFLGTGPKSKYEVVDHVYGERLDIEVKLNRFKSLLGTLRRKHPHLIVCEKGMYRLAESFKPPKKRSTDAA